MNTYVELKDSLTSREAIEKIVAEIVPYDKLEKEHLQETLAWIKSGASIFRTKNPDTFKKHLCSYVVLYDQLKEKILLMNHKKAQLWLPAGGHIEENEHPRDTAKRECLEELNIDPEFWRDEPVFLTSTLTVGLTPGHNDVNLWYVIKGESNNHLNVDPHEFSAFKWFKFEEIPYECSDLFMRRFIGKMKTLVEC